MLFLQLIHIILYIIYMFIPYQRSQVLCFFLLPSECSKNIIAPTPVVFVVAHTAVVLYLVKLCPFCSEMLLNVGSEESGVVVF